MGWIGCVHCKKLGCDFVARTSSLIAPVQPILHRVSCSNKMVPKAPKHYKIQQNMSLGTNGVDRVHSLWKLPTQVRGMNFCTSLARFAPSFVRPPNSPKCTQIVWNTPNTSVQGPMVRTGCVRCEKFKRDIVARTLALVRPVLHRVS